MRKLLRLAPAAGLLLGLGACVSLEEAPMAARPLSSKQRLLLVVYASPGPTLSEEDSKGETAAKIIPGLGLVVKDVQDQRDLKLSKELQQYLPAWDPAGLFESAARKQVESIGTPSKVIGPADTGIPADAWPKLNAAADVLEWQQKYFLPQREGAPARNYSRFLQLDDTVVLEINLAYGLHSDGENGYTPSVRAVTKLLRANVMQPLWRREDVVSEKEAAKSLYDFEVSPDLLVSAWKRLLPPLSAKVVEELRKNLAAAGVPLDPYGAQRAAAEAVSQPEGLPMGPGWAPAPIAVPPATEASAAPVPGAPFAPKPSTP